MKGNTVPTELPKAVDILRKTREVYKRSVWTLVALMFASGFLPTFCLAADEGEKKGEEKPLFQAIQYGSQERRDPFLSILAVTKQKKTVKKTTLNPLENYDIPDFRLIGVVFNGSDYYASVILPDGKSYTIRMGMSIGLYNGKVVAIKDDKLTVREYVMDYTGKSIPRDVVLTLRKEEG